ncbi:MAG: glycosyltransferase [Desulfobacula sp.]|uniref:glycosyltransferase n=1 Tax=Desulfobacula sp. TaxID=2593537 RepID=UPI0025BFEB8B|nr:glycosyltransferase [Desulfobacula sp.]MCD4720918.1 glycosyltransferase [Desulfobacula sp.]
MKILHLIDSGGLYGAEVMLLSLVSAQVKMGLVPVIGSIRKKGIGDKPIEIEARKLGLDVQVFEMHTGPNFFGIWEIVKFARQNNFDLFHSHGYKTNIMLGLMPSFMRGLPVITTLHGWTSAGTWSKMRINEELDAFSLCFVDRIVLVNQGMLDNKKVRKLPEEKICVINNGIEIDGNPGIEHCYLEESLKTDLKAFCSQGRVIASIGRLSHEKGFNYLVEAERILRDEKNEDVRLLLIGEGRQRSNLEQQAKECGLSEYFFITGYVKNARALLEMVDCYVISSLTEGLPITLLEVMASGTPIVVTEVGGIPHVVEHGQDALLVPEKNPKAIVDAVYELLHKPELAARLTTKAEQKVKSRFTSTIMAEKYSSLYSEMLQ